MRTHDACGAVVCLPNMPILKVEFIDYEFWKCDDPGKADWEEACADFIRIFDVCHCRNANAR